MHTKRITTVIALSTLCTPLLVWAMPADFKGIIMYIIDLIKLTIPILMGLALLYFFWGLSKFVLNAGNSTELAKGKSFMIWGIGALFLLVTFNAIIALIVGDLEFGDGKTIPTLPGRGSTPSVDSRILPESITFP